MGDDFVKVGIPLWQVIIIASDAGEMINSEEDLVKTCMKVTYQRLAVLFGE